MPLRDDVAAALCNADLGTVVFKYMTAVTQAKYLCLADAAIEAVQSHRESASEITPEPQFADLGDGDSLADGVEDAVGDWYERNGLK